MILADTSVWVDHLRQGDGRLVRLLELGLIGAHPFVTGELALGNLRQRSAILSYLQQLPQVPVAMHSEVLDLVERYGLHGRGVGYVDVHLLASAYLRGNCTIWTRDKRLCEVARSLGVAEEELPKPD